MARITGKTTEKRLASSRVRKILRKHGKFTVRAKPGPHSNDRAVPLGFIVRDLLELAMTLKEAKHILHTGNVRVDGRIRKSHHFEVGLFDIVQIPQMKKTYQLALDHKGRFYANEIAENTHEKYCRVIRKRMISGNQLEISTEDGKTFSGKGHERVQLGDTLKVKVPENKIVKIVPLHEGCLAYVTQGKHAGKQGIVKAIIPGNERKEKSVHLTVDNVHVETSAENIMVIEK